MKKPLLHALAHTYDVCERATIAETDTVRVHTLLLTAGQSVPWHRHSAVDDTFVCLSGSMVVLTDDDRTETALQPGEMVTVSAGVGHSVLPVTGAGTKFLLIQATGRHDYIPLLDLA